MYFLIVPYFLFIKLWVSYGDFTVRVYMAMLLVFVIFYSVLVIR